MNGLECVLRGICVSGCSKVLENWLVKVSLTQRHAVVELKATLNGKSSVCCDPRKNDFKKGFQFYMKHGPATHDLGCTVPWGLCYQKPSTSLE